MKPGSNRTGSTGESIGRRHELGWDSEPESAERNAAAQRHDVRPAPGRGE